MLSIPNAGVDIRDQATAFTMSVVAAMVLSDLTQAVIDRMTPTLIEHHNITYWFLPGKAH